MREAGFDFDIVVADIDESPVENESASELVERLALAKAVAVMARLSGEIDVVGADTVVVLGDSVLGKPADAEAAAGMLSAMSGSTHRVLTGVAVVSRDGSGVMHESMLIDEAQVTFRDLTRTEIDSHVATGEWADKAGGYGIQPGGGGFVESIQGSYDTVVGLDINLVMALLNGTADSC